MNTRLKKIFTSVLLFCFAAGLSVSARANEINFLDRTNSKEFKYTKNELTVDVNSEKISMDAPVLYGNSGSAIASLSDLYQDQLLVDCVFSLEDSSITLKKDNNEIKLQVGSKTVSINGTETEVTEEVRVLSDSNGVSKVYVPSKAVATGLSMEYRWDKATDTVQIKNNRSLKILNDFSDSTFSINVPEGFDLAKDLTVTEDFRFWKTTYTSSGVEKSSRKISITLPGTESDYIRYLKSNIINKCEYVKGIDVTYSEGSLTFTYELSVIRAIAGLTSDGNTVSFSFAAPKDVYDKIIVMDPGHGGADYGATRKGIYEANLSLAMAYTYAKDLFEAQGIKVYYTRTDNTYLSLYQRRMLSAEVGADLSISVHQNTDSTESSSYRGTCTFYSTYNNNPNSGGLTSKILAETMQKNLLEVFGSRDLKVQAYKQLDLTTLTGAYQESMLENLPKDSAEYILFKDMIENKTYSVRNIPAKTDKNARVAFAAFADVPSILIETGIMSNDEDLAKLTDPEMQKKIAKCFVDTVAELFAQYPTGR